MSKKRILVISQHYWPENFRITDICEGFVEKGCEVDVLCGLPNYPKGYLYDGYKYFKPRRQQKNGVNIYRCGEILRKGNSGIRIFLNYISFPFNAFFHLVRFFGKKYDGVFSYQTSPVLMTWPAIVYSKLTHTPLTTYVLDLWPENLYSVLNIKSEFWRNVCRRISHWHYKKADKLIAMSPALQKKVICITQKSENEVFCIPQYCESFYEKSVQDDALSQRLGKKFKVLFAGNFSPAQGLDVLVSAAKKLKNDHIDNILFVMVGDGMSHADFVADVKQNDVENYFVFEGQKPVTDIPRYQTACDALFAGLSASDFIGLTVPAKVTSYMAAAKPVLLCMDGEGPKLINQADCGLCAPAGDVDAFYTALLQLYNMSSEQRARLGQNAFEYHQKYLKREIILDKLLKAVL